MKKSILAVILTLICSNAFALRFAPMAIQVQFNSIGSGVDSVAKSAIESLISETQVNDSTLNVTQKRWGREGERNLCVQTSLLYQHRKLMNAISRVTVIQNTNAVNLTQVKPTGVCDNKSLAYFQDSQLGVFSNNSKSFTLTCSAIIEGENPYSYQAKLLLKEELEGGVVTVKAKFLQESVNARFAQVEHVLSSSVVTDKADIIYSNKETKILLKPNYSADTIAYIGTYNGFKFHCHNN